mmetsp:Transcript_21912/g.75302  ORF Transcript_21912/g.75302 Transcript_21912/m.75302 type:complete len:290 (+) Transcript_21912:873-1742(+)
MTLRSSQRSTPSRSAAPKASSASAEVSGSSERLDPVVETTQASARSNSEESSVAFARLFWSRKMSSCAIGSQRWLDIVCRRGGRPPTMDGNGAAPSDVRRWTGTAADDGRSDAARGRPAGALGAALGPKDLRLAAGDASTKTASEIDVLLVDSLPSRRGDRGSMVKPSSSSVSSSRSSSTQPWSSARTRGSSARGSRAGPRRRAGCDVASPSTSVWAVVSGDIVESKVSFDSRERRPVGVPHSLSPSSSDMASIISDTTASCDALRSASCSSRSAMRSSRSKTRSAASS